MSDLTITDFSRLLVSEIHRILPQDNSNRLHLAMRYSVLAPAKHLRPFLVFASSWIFGIKEILKVAAAVEFIHVYSLIHDDLPCMDNSDFRRGQPACHKKFDEATAILAGDALLTLAFEVLSTSIEDSNKCVRVIKTLSTAIGYNGMVGGQVLDLVASNVGKVHDVHLLKTAKLFSAACEIGAIMGGASGEECKALSSYGIKIGLAFQAKDDLNDYLQKNETSNIVLSIGLENTKEYIKKLLDDAANYLNLFLNRTNYLYSVVELIRDL
ncbi:polyprenyl synthetase family protein [Candidatus Mesenet endosymbiont of Agriotes lineatus]|uniref:polyprenyl synthetase family protein n=1 Tax=Candidatus Mesenet endosymbiont of Agriotes lineatus TaxID=3077948 RepID=UPI0030D3DA82